MRADALVWNVSPFRNALTHGKSNTFSLFKAFNFWFHESIAFLSLFLCCDVLIWFSRIKILLAKFIHCTNRAHGSECAANTIALYRFSYSFVHMLRACFSVVYLFNEPHQREQIMEFPKSGLVIRMKTKPTFSYLLLDFTWIPMHCNMIRFVVVVVLVVCNLVRFSFHLLFMYAYKINVAKFCVSLQIRRFLTVWYYK